MVQEVLAMSKSFNTVFVPVGGSDQRQVQRLPQLERSTIQR